MNLKESLFSNKAKIESVEVEGVTYYCRDYGAIGRDYYETWLIDRQSKAVDGKLDVVGIRAVTLICGLCDEHGKPILTADDYEATCNLPGAVVGPLFDKIAELNKISDADIDELKKS